MTHPMRNDAIPYQDTYREGWPIGTKGVWVEPKDSGQYSLLEEDISLPAAVISQAALTNNLTWMQTFADKNGVKLCPHGKTSMTPTLFKQQLANGAWGMTIATPAQAEVAVAMGAKNIIIANQLVGKANMASIAALQSENVVDIYCSVDSRQNVEQLSAFFSAKNQRMKVFVELGVSGGRCGVRGTEAAAELARYIHALPGVALAGVEVYEGVIHGDDMENRIRAFIEDTAQFCQSLNNEGLIDTPDTILTGAGSAWYDIVADVFSRYADLLPVIRPGCYVTHDSGIYRAAQEKVNARAKQRQGIAAQIEGDLQNALEVWAYVISLPEKGKAVIGLGKRDAAYDAGLPLAERGFRQGKAIDVSGLVATAVMDQHTFMDVPEHSDLQVGDILTFSTSHPCLTFDKWRYIALSDENCVVREWMTTQF
ncbi:amino acid deaminase [Enterovibrio norvegicus]